ncbi:hypothetical protein vseg_012500 [Gypsophila vaccaria]
MEVNEDGFIEELISSVRREITWVNPNNEDGFSSFLGDYYVNPGGGDFSVSSLLSDEIQCGVAKPSSLSSSSLSLPSTTMYDQDIIPTTFSPGLCTPTSNVKRVEGQPSKNLMAERRRRKRLNDRLAMLRSVVPKISKMDRTSILGDTIDYMKELLGRINNLQEEVDGSVGCDQFNVVNIFKDSKPNEVLVRNTPKFDVERRKLDTRVELCCAGKPGLLLSTITTLEALGLEVQHCVISCFNDFSLHASCYPVMEHGSLLSSEDIKQALFRNAGYGGRCL